MARRKEYNEAEVIEKAMYLFWSKGYEATSVRMLEKVMGINQFSIYSSFGSKHGVFLESIKCYESKLKANLDKLRKSTKGIEGIKEFFYDSLTIINNCDNPKGCLITNASNEFAGNEDQLIQEQITRFIMALKELFVEKMRESGIEDEELLRKQANYLLIAKQGLSVASKVSSDQELSDYIELTFKSL